MQLLTFLLAAGIANFSGGVLSVVSWIFVRRKYKNAERKYRGMASIIIPFKGKNMGNIHYFLQQEYPVYEVIVVVDSKEEAKEIEKKYEDKKLRVEITKPIPTCSGKLAALLTGVKKARGKIYVFADADIKPDENWLSYLVGGLNNNVITTGYRWYSKNKILSIWNVSIASVLFYDAFNFAWGGATAITAEDFEKLGVANIWKNEIVDDLTLTKIAKKKGYRIRFIPQAIADADEEESTFKWMNKQMAWVRYYFPGLWRIALFLNTAMRLAIFAGILIMPFYPLTGMLLFSPVLFDFLRGWQEHNTFVSLSNKKAVSPCMHALIRPLISFMLSYNLISSAFMREIEWGGKKYKLALHTS